MRDRPITIGDLVQIVRPKPCGCTNVIGLVFIVKSLDCTHRLNRCGNCNSTYGPLPQAEGEIRAPLTTLKRIPSLEELEGAKTDEPMKEPA